MGLPYNPAMSRSALALAKTLVFTLIAPGTVAGLVPWWLRGGTQAVAIRGPQEWLAGAMISAGVAIYLHTAFWGFAWIGGGTPAPVAPTKTLVVSGLHRFVRNPMYIGVGLIIAGQAWLFRSPAIALYLALFATAVQLFVLYYEEPTLRRQFGAQYERYRASVPRWFPKICF
jgi:protein-S-isoprenylcysteine O-methyltransferase Ste14